MESTPLRAQLTPWAVSRDTVPSRVALGCLKGLLASPLLNLTERSQLTIYEAALLCPEQRSGRDPDFWEHRRKTS